VSKSATTAAVTRSMSAICESARSRASCASTARISRSPTS
jgi:hypothetical protein